MLLSSSFVLYGIPITNQIAIGSAHLISHSTFEVNQYNITEENIDFEQNRLRQAKAKVQFELSKSFREFKQTQPEEIVAMIEVQKLILEDSNIVENAEEKVQENLCNAEMALVMAMEKIVTSFDELEDVYLSERKYDIMQIAERLIKYLQSPNINFEGALKVNENAGIYNNSENLIQNQIIIAHDISPSELLTLRHKQQVVGFITESGGVNSHTSIMARSQEIPAIIGAINCRRLIRNNEIVIVDGNLGFVIVNPDADTLEEYQRMQISNNLKEKGLQRLINVKAITLDKVQVDLCVNIEYPEDVIPALTVGAAGVGLFRSEFLFLDKNTLPDEETQFEAYKKVLIALEGAPVTIRTIDLGADKMPVNFVHKSPKAVSDLGLRAIRLCFAHPELFKTQLRALLRASFFGNLKIVLPMISSVEEVLDFNQIFENTKAELRQEDVKFNPNIPIGVMVEIPATIFILHKLQKLISFISLGTNDLFQYALAVDRTDSTVSHLYNHYHIGVLTLIDHCIKIAYKNNLPINVCGELGGDPKFAKFLLGLGLRSFSMNSSQILKFKQQVINSSTIELAKKIRGWKNKNSSYLEKLINNL